jgi:predicted RNA polymerase sigma factor
MAYRQAIALCGNDAERAFLTERLALFSGNTGGDEPA